MARKLKWAPRAQKHLVEACRYIADKNPEAAKKLASEITRLAEELAELPFSGRIVPEYKDESLRERIHKPYRIVYRLVSQDVVEILSVYHSAQRLPDRLGSD